MPSVAHPSRPSPPPPPLPQYCHANLRIAHRDIKLGNVLLNTKYQIPILKLCDFGYSKVRRKGGGGGGGVGRRWQHGVLPVRGRPCIPLLHLSAGRFASCCLALPCLLTPPAPPPPFRT